ncbi:zinc knuckle CX2CX4HX4C containing protein [Tanacetum coccineum]
MLDPDLSPQPPPVVNPTMKKYNKALKPLKTTRTMNPESKNTMKHDEMLGGSSDVTFKKINSRSRSKRGDTVMVSEEIESWEDANDASIGKEGLVDFEEVNNNGIDIMPEIPVPVAENPILNPGVGSGSKPKSPTRVSFGEVKRPGIFKVSGVDLFKGVKSVSNFDVEEGSRMNDVNMGDNGSVKKPFSFISALTGDKVSGNNKLKYVPGSLNDAGREVADMDPVIEDGSTKWNMTVIGHFVGYRMSYREIMGNLRRMWRSYQFDDIIMNNSGLYFCKFKSHDGMQAVIENGLWLVDNKPFFVQKWEPGLCMSKPEVTKVPLWVKIYNVPLEAWNVEGISRIASRVGNPIIMDRITTAMCEKSYGRASFARVLVEVDSTKGLVDSVEVWYRSLGKSMMLDVEYTWRPPVCEHCKFFGHTLENTVKGRRYKPFTQNKIPLTSRFARHNIRHHLSISSAINPFPKTRYLWRADLLDITPTYSFKISWSDKMLNYYSDKWKSRKDNILTPDDVLRGRIDELQEKIVLINRGVLKNAARVANKRIVDECAGKKVQSVYNSFYAEAYNADLDRVKELKWEKELLEVDLFILSKQPLTDSIKEFWTEGMIDVEDGSNATASFMTADNVSNLHDKSMADMQGSIASDPSSFQ